VRHGDGSTSEIEYRLAWAPTDLHGIAALNNSTRGIWSTRGLRRSISLEDIAARHAAYVAQLQGARKARRRPRRGCPSSQRPEQVRVDRVPVARRVEGLALALVL